MAFFMKTFLFLWVFMREGHRSGDWVFDYLYINERRNICRWLSLFYNLFYVQMGSLFPLELTRTDDKLIQYCSYLGCNSMIKVFRFIDSQPLTRSVFTFWRIGNLWTSKAPQ